MFGSKNDKPVEQIEKQAKKSAKEARERGAEIETGARQEVAASLRRAADFISKESRGRRVSGKARNRMQDLVNGLDDAAIYLEEHSLGDLSEEATEVVRQTPWLSLMVAFVAGIVIGVLLSNAAD